MKRRKMMNEPVEIVRHCICSLQGRQLCGVCTLERRWCSGRIFAAISYHSALALLKTAAKFLKFDNDHMWGTHVFRRGWAEEALKEGGPQALYFSGGWKGVAALGYAEAQTRGAIYAAEWVIDHSDSEDSI